jgi:5-methylthioadenosine/S-adenosylhomocysteine deaminase
MRTVLRAELAVTMDPVLGLVEHPELVIEDGRIVSVTSRVGSPERADADDAAGHGVVWELQVPDAVLLPGFVNAHTHAAMTLLRGYADDLPLRKWLEERIWPAERLIGEEDVYAGTLLACAEMAASGVTTYADMYLYMDGAAEAAEKAGIRTVLAPGIFAALGPVEDTIEEVSALVARWDGRADGRIRAVLGPHAVYTCPPEFLREVAAAARDLGVGVQMHLSETRDEVEEARAQHGASPIQIAAETGILEAGCLAAHCVWIDDADVALLAETGTRVAHNPRSNMKLASGAAPVEQLLAAGVPVGLGTDGAASTNQLTMFEEMRAASLLAKVTRSDPTALAAATVLEMATLGGARAVGLEAEIGSLTPGKRADVVVVRLDRPGLLPLHDPVSTLVYSAQDQDVAWVFCAGEAVAQDGRPLHFEMDAAIDDARRRARRIADEAGGR